MAEPKPDQEMSENDLAVLSGELLDMSDRLERLAVRLRSAARLDLHIVMVPTRAGKTDKS